MALSCVHELIDVIRLRGTQEVHYQEWCLDAWPKLSEGAQLKRWCRLRLGLRDAPVELSRDSIRVANPSRALEWIHQQILLDHQRRSARARPRDQVDLVASVLDLLAEISGHPDDRRLVLVSPGDLHWRDAYRLAQLGCAPDLPVVRASILCRRDADALLDAMTPRSEPVSWLVIGQARKWMGLARLADYSSVGNLRGMPMPTTILRDQEPAARAFLLRVRSSADELWGPEPAALPHIPTRHRVHARGSAP